MGLFFNVLLESLKLSGLHSFWMLSSIHIFQTQHSGAKEPIKSSAIDVRTYQIGIRMSHVETSCFENSSIFEVFQSVFERDFFQCAGLRA